VLIDYIADIERATEFAEKVDEAEVWTMLGKAQMNPEGIVAAIAAFIKAADSSEFISVISTAEMAGEPVALVEYLTMCRKKVKEAHIDTSLIYAYAKAGMHSELEEFISAPNVGRIQDVAERCYSEEMYLAAKIMFTSISNFARLATCLVRLGEFQASVDAARKANSTRTWKEVNASCVENGEFRLAQICALHIIVNPDEVDELVSVYEKRGHFEEIMAVFEQGLGLERAHMGIYTELGVLYSKYKDEKCATHLATQRMSSGRAASRASPGGGSSDRVATRAPGLILGLGRSPRAGVAYRTRPLPEGRRVKLNTPPAAG